MSQSKIERVAVISTGVIGASWATNFLARGLDVIATDPAPGAEETLRATIAAQWPAMETIGLAPGASQDRLRFVATVEEAAADAQLVQENGPESLEMKRDLFNRCDAIAPPETILVTSSSSITPSEFQDACARHPERVVLGHPFNPPHLIPLVEVAGGKATTPAVIARTMEFYRAVGKHPIHLKKEIRGHVANRLQAALWREAFHLVANGIASVEDVDAAIAHGPGLRWALLGPFVNLHLSGGPGGIAELFQKPLWQAVESMWADLGTATVDTDLARRVPDGVAEELQSRDHDKMVQERDAILLQLLHAKSKTDDLP